jgi:Flp pilus assembly CpaE family ATPase
VPRIPGPAYRRALELADRRVIVVDQTMRSMRDAVRLVKLLGDGEGSGAEPALAQRNVFVLNRVGEAGRDALSLKDIHSVLQVQPVSQVPFLPNLVMPAANHGVVAASKPGKFSNAIGALAVELSGRSARRRWWRRAAK